jgi:hypothetical protein
VWVGRSGERLDAGWASPSTEATGATGGAHPQWGGRKVDLGQAFRQPGSDELFGVDELHLVSRFS